ncbi:MAG TPA: single-stranded DNA-binding protein [Ilumatobacter sp.]
MANDNFVQIIGNVTRDPELRFTTSGAAVCSFGIAWTPRRRNANGEWEDGETSFFNCSAWRDLGENIAASITKGARVVVTGSVRSRDWEDRDGNKRTSIEIDVDDCAPSLRWAQAKVERTERSGGGGGFSGGGGGGGGASRAPDPVYGDEEPF